MDTVAGAVWRGQVEQVCMTDDGAVVKDVEGSRRSPLCGMRLDGSFPSLAEWYVGCLLNKDWRRGTWTMVSSIPGALVHRPVLPSYTEHIAPTHLFHIRFLKKLMHLDVRNSC